MVKNWLARLKHVLGAIRDFLDEKAIASVNSAPLSRLQKFAHFWLMVWKSFSRNRCPVHASALAYTTLLALIPMIFVVISVSNSILKQEGGDHISRMIDRLLVSMTPAATTTNSAAAIASTTNINEVIVAIASNIDLVSETNNPAAKLASTNAPPTEAKSASEERDELVSGINRFVKNIQSSKLGVTGGVVLVFIAISMVARIEETFNDIWGVSKGRSWRARIVHYWAVISLGPVLLVMALRLASESRMVTTWHLLRTMPLISRGLYEVFPVVVLCLSFTVFYVLMPNTRVHWRPALVGGVVGGILWHLNNYFSLFYVSRWVTNSKIYGSLAVIPVFMVGLYFSWLIVLFGAQVAYAYQNRAAYLQEKQIENINQRGREFIALRVMQCIGQRFQAGRPPGNMPDIADQLAVPTRLVEQILQTLLAARLVVEVAGLEPAYAPSRPLENLNCHDILLALRAGQGQELVTRDEPARTEVYGEFEKIMRAEEQASSTVTVLAMVKRAEDLAALSAQPVKAVTDGAKNP
jgi:membrane protein